MKPGDTIIAKLRNGIWVKGFASEHFGNDYYPDYVNLEKKVRVRATNVGRNRKAHQRSLHYFLRRENVRRTRLVLFEKNKSK